MTGGQIAAILPSATLAAVYTTTASGGVMSFTVLIEGFTNAAGAVGYIAGRVTRALVVKR